MLPVRYSTHQFQHGLPQQLTKGLSAFSWISIKSFSRFFSVSFLESLRPQWDCLDLNDRGCHNRTNQWSSSSFIYTCYSHLHYLTKGWSLSLSLIALVSVFQQHRRSRFVKPPDWQLLRVCRWINSSSCKLNSSYTVRCLVTDTATDIGLDIVTLVRSHITCCGFPCRQCIDLIQAFRIYGDFKRVSCPTAVKLWLLDWLHLGQHIQIALKQGEQQSIITFSRFLPVS